MEPSTPFMDALDDGLVQNVIKRLQRGWPRSWQQLSCSSHRLCKLTRRTVEVSMRADAAGVLSHLKAHPQMAFTHVRKLHLEAKSLRDAQQWALLGDAAAAAADAWPQLEEMQLACTNDCDPGCFTGALLALRAAPALRRLELDRPDTQSLRYLPVLTQLTHLELCGDEQNLLTDDANSSSSRPLALVPNLVSLKLYEVYLAAGHTSCVLPPQLTSLHLDHCWLNSNGDWMEQVVQCGQLQKLWLEGDGFDASNHPTLLIEAVAAGLTGLMQLQISRDGEDAWEDDGFRLQAALRQMRQRAGFPAILQDDPWPPAWPLGDAVDWVEDPAGFVVVPPPNMGALVNLQHLSLDCWGLLVSTDQYWRALGGCTSLRSLAELHASVPPPFDVTFPHLTRLEVTTSTSPGDTVTLLGAFPALRELELSIAPKGDGADEVPSGGIIAVHSAVTARFTLYKPQQLEEGRHVHCLAGYCSTLYRTLPGLRNLHLDWAYDVPLLSGLPAVSSLQQLSSLRLRSTKLNLDPGFLQQGYIAQAVELQQVVQAVEGASALQVLDVCLEPAPGSSCDQLVLGLKQALPGLTRIGVRGGAEGLAPSTLEALQPHCQLACAKA